MSLETLLAEDPRPGVRRIRLTRAATMNTLTLELLRELEQEIDRAVDDGVRVLIVTGSGRAFCSGAHLKYFVGDKPIFTERFDTRDRYFERIARLFDKVELIGIPVIAAINGFAMGGGFELALACDFRIFADTACVGLPEAQLGATPGAGGVQKLARFIGRGKALEWILLARHVDAAEADRLGLAYRVVPPEMVDVASLELAAALMQLSPQAQAQCKLSIHLSGDVDLRSARRFGVEALSAMVGSPDWLEGMDAFVAKRPPRFGTTLNSEAVMGRLFDTFRKGQRFETPARTITEADIVSFAGLTGDYNPVHCNETFASETDFGGRIAHGPMGIGLAFGLASRLDLIDGTVVALLGVNWDFKAPVRPGDTIHAMIEVIEMRNVKDASRGLLGLGFTILNQNNTVLQAGTARLLMRRTPHPAARWGEIVGSDEN